MSDVGRVAAFAGMGILTFATGGLTGPALFWTKMAGWSAVIGGNAYSMQAQRRKLRNQRAEALRASRTLAAPSNWPDKSRVIPIVYGQWHIDTPNLVWYRPDGEQVQHRALAFCGAPVTEISDIRIDQHPIENYPACSAIAYFHPVGTSPLDARMAETYKGTLDGISHVVATITASESLTGSAVVSATVTGRIIPVYHSDTEQWETTYSNNPAWIIRDFLVSFCGVPFEAIDEHIDDWAEFADYCDEIVEGDGDRALTPLTGVTASGGVNPQYATDGLDLLSSPYWTANHSDPDSLGLLGTLDIGGERLINAVELVIVPGRSHYDVSGAPQAGGCTNWAVAISEDGTTWTTVADKTSEAGTRIWAGAQLVEFAPTVARYVRIWGSGGGTYYIDYTRGTGDLYSLDWTYSFGVSEVKIYECTPSKRHTLDVVIDSSREAQDIVQEMLASTNAFLLDTGRGIKPVWDRPGMESVAHFDVEDTIEGSVTYRSAIDYPAPNRVEVKYTEPGLRWDLTTAVAEDPTSQDELGVQAAIVTLPYVTRRAEATRTARTLMNRAVFERQSLVWDGMVEMLMVEPGDVFTYSDPAVGYDHKPFRITTIDYSPDGRCTVSAVEYLEYIYDDVPGSRVTAGISPTLPRPDARPAPPRLTAIWETLDTLADGTSLPGIAGTFSVPAEPNFDHVEITVTGGTDVPVVVSTDGTFAVTGLQPGEYTLMLQSVSLLGMRSVVTPYTTVTVPVVGKQVPPSDVTGFAFAADVWPPQLSWDSAWDANRDLDGYELRDGASWAAGSAVATDLKTTSFSLPMAKRSYNLWIAARDRSGNYSSGPANLPVTIAAPAAPAAPSVSQVGTTAHLVRVTCLPNAYVTQYDIHRSSSISFTPSPDTIVAVAAAGKSVTTIQVDADPDVTYYYRVCAIDPLSAIAGDRYTYPSSATAAKTVLSRNLLPNGGFDHVKQGGAFTASDGVPLWTWVAFGAVTQIAVESWTDCPYVYEGKYCLSLHTGAGGGYYGLSQKIPGNPGDTVTVSFYATCPSGAARVKLYLFFYDSSGARLSGSDIFSDIYPAQSSTPRRYSATYTIPSGAAYAAVRPIVTSSTGKMYLDAMQYERGSAATPYQPPDSDAIGSIVSVVQNPVTGTEIYAGNDLVGLLGSIGGLSDGHGHTIDLAAMGLWLKGSFSLLNSSGQAILTADGLTGDAFVDGTISESILASALQTKIGSTMAVIDVQTTDFCSEMPAMIVSSGEPGNFPVAMVQGRVKAGSWEVLSPWETLPMTFQWETPTHIYSVSYGVLFDSELTLVFTATGIRWNKSTGLAQYYADIADCADLAGYPLETLVVTDGWPEIRFRYALVGRTSGE